MLRAQRRSLALVVTCIVAAFTFLVASACSSSNPGSGFGSNDGTSSGSGGKGASSSSGASSSGTASGGASSGVTFKEDGGTTPPPLLTDGGCQGLQCQIAASCTNDGGTTITGTIMDPAGANPLYNVLAYVPMFDPADPSKIPTGAGIEPIQGGVTFPSGVSCDSCSYLYSGNPIAVGVSGTDGTFTITNAPSGTNIPIVVQVGKWRTHTTVAKVTDCQNASAGNIDLPSSASGSDPIVSMPQIAISMGMADTMECLPYRIGLDVTEFTSGASSTGHVHIFSGGGGFGGTSSVPAAPTSLWDSLADLEKYDVTLFSCEGQETASANPPLLEQYVNAGGRAFLSHFHYAWLAGPLSTGASAGYSANADWGSALATWNSADQGADEGATLPAEITTTLNVGGGTFAKGVALEQWLGNVHALGTSGASSTEVAVASPSFDPNVTSSNTVSQPWATFDMTNAPSSVSSTDKSFPTAYFSFNTPVGATTQPDGGAPPYCGRVVFSGLHVGAADSDTTRGSSMPSSTGCSPGPGQLSPQEKVLEFMLFDLSSCVISDKEPPPKTIPVVY